MRDIISFKTYQKMESLERKVESLQAQIKAQTEAIQALRKEISAQSDMLRTVLNHFGLDHGSNEEHIVDASSKNINAIVGQNDTNLNSVSMDVNDKVRTYCVFTYVYITICFYSHMIILTYVYCHICH